MVSGRSGLGKGRRGWSGGGAYGVELDDGADHAGAEVAGLAGGDEVGAGHCGLVLWIME